MRIMAMALAVLTIISPLGGLANARNRTAGADQACLSSALMVRAKAPKAWPSWYSGPHGIHCWYPSTKVARHSHSRPVVRSHDVKPDQPAAEAPPAAALWHGAVIAVRPDFALVSPWKPDRWTDDLRSFQHLLDGREHSGRSAGAVAVAFDGIERAAGIIPFVDIFPGRVRQTGLTSIWIASEDASSR